MITILGIAERGHWWVKTFDQEHDVIDYLMGQSRGVRIVFQKARSVVSRRSLDNFTSAWNNIVYNIEKTLSEYDEDDKKRHKEKVESELKILSKIGSIAILKEFDMEDFQKTLQEAQEIRRRIRSV